MTMRTLLFAGLLVPILVVGGSAEAAGPAAMLTANRLVQQLSHSAVNDASEAQPAINADVSQAPTATPAAPGAIRREADSTRRFGVNGGIEYRQLAVTDMDPENDRYTVLWVRGEYNLMEKAQVFARVGLLRRFIAEPGESGYFLQDTTLGGRYGHEISLEALNLGERKLSLSHQVLLYLPTSRASLLQTLRLAPELRSTASIDVVRGLSVSVQGRFQYRFHRYAERAGPGAGMNTQYLLGVLPSVSYTLPELGSFGRLSASAYMLSTWQRRYASRETYLSTASEAAPLFQMYGWGASLSYAPLKYASISVGVDHGGSVLRNGIVNTFVAHRDETEIGVSLTGRF